MSGAPLLPLGLVRVAPTGAFCLLGHLPRGVFKLLHQPARTILSASIKGLVSDVPGSVCRGEFPAHLTAHRIALENLAAPRAILSVGMTLPLAGIDRMNRALAKTACPFHAESSCAALRSRLSFSRANRIRSRMTWLIEHRRFSATDSTQPSKSLSRTKLCVVVSRFFRMVADCSEKPAVVKFSSCLLTKPPQKLRQTIR